MKITIIGKNSSVFLLVKPYLLKHINLIELESQQSINCLLEKKCGVRQVFAIFSGIVSQDIDLLEKIENFHSSLASKLADIENAQVILISSSAVYGNHKSIFSELDDCRPISNYGHSKFKIEQNYLKILKRNVSILRLGNVLGLDTVAKIFSQNNIGDRYLDCRPDYSTPQRTYVDTQILSHVILYYATKCEDLPQILNVGRRRSQAMDEAISELGMNFNFMITDSVLTDLTLDTSTLFKILDSIEV